MSTRSIVAVVLSMLALAGIAIWWLTSRASASAPPGYTYIGKVGDQRFWARRYTLDGDPQVSIVSTGPRGTICDDAGSYTDQRALICNDGVSDVGTAWAMPVPQGVDAVTVRSAEGEVFPLLVVPPPRGWPLGFAIGAVRPDGALAVRAVVHDAGAP